MKYLTLKRLTLNESFTFGVFSDSETCIPLCVSLELPWKNNDSFVSCIPTGEYNVVKYSSDKYRDCFQILDVPGRDGVLIHTGNTTEDTTGCPLTGTSFGMLKNKPAVLGSKNALDIIKVWANNNSFRLKVT